MRPLAYLIDGHYQIFRAYHALPDLRAPDGTPVGAVRGYAQTLLRMLRRLAPTHLAVAFDHALTSFRNDLYAGYKQGRTEAPADLEPQFALCAELTRALGIPLYEWEKYEADDVIATLVAALVPAGLDIAIATRDKDLGALVSDRVCLLDVATDARSGPAEIEARLGVAPCRVTDYLALVGDDVDCVPGVRGIGPAGARALLAAFGSLAGIPRGADCEEFGRAAATRLEPRTARRLFAALRDGERDLALSLELVRLRSDVPLDVRADDLVWQGASRAELEPLLERLGLEGLVARVPRWRSS